MTGPQRSGGDGMTGGGDGRSALAEMTVSVLGGTGPQGRGLARRFAAAGLDVVLGSRDPARAALTASSLPGRVFGMSNADAAAAGAIVVVAVPWDGHAELLRELAPVLAGKIVVDCVNPLGFDKKGPFALDVPEVQATDVACVLFALTVRPPSPARDRDRVPAPG